jgi:hypothetical protein
MAPNRTLEDFHAGSRDRQSQGGVGKTTLATNLAGYFARHGHAVMLGDTDRQQSSRAWLNLRPESAPPISTWDIDADNIARLRRAPRTWCWTRPPACMAGATLMS